MDQVHSSTISPRYLQMEKFTNGFRAVPILKTGHWGSTLWKKNSTHRLVITWAINSILYIISHVYMIYAFIHSFVHSFIHLFIYSFIYLFILFFINYIYIQKTLNTLFWLGSTFICRLWAPLVPRYRDQRWRRSYVVMCVSVTLARSKAVRLMGCTDYLWLITD